MDLAASAAGARLPVRIELLEQRRQVIHDVLHIHLDAVHERMAARAVPFESVVHVARPGFAPTAGCVALVVPNDYRTSATSA